MKSDLYGGSDIANFRAEKGTEHALDLERSFWFGQKKENYGEASAGTLATRSTGGILEHIESGDSYVQDQGGILTAPDFNTFLREAFTYGNTTKTLFAGGLVLEAINEIARGAIRMRPLEKKYGMLIQEWETTSGKINIVKNPLFAHEYGSYAFLLDMNCFTLRPYKDRDTKLETNIQARDVDGRIDQYITEMGLQRVESAKCALIKGIV